MSKMSAMDQEIEMFTRGDEVLKSKIIEDIHAFWDGTLRFGDMCWEAQCIWENYETGKTEEIHGSLGLVRSMNSNDDDDLFISMEEE